MSDTTACQEPRCACRGRECVPCAQGAHRVLAEPHVEAKKRKPESET